MGYKIGSFNMHKLGDKKSDDDIEQIARILNKASFDIIAMQEVFSNKPLQTLIGKLKGNWKFSWDIPARSGDGEGYAFLWNTDRIELSYSNSIDNNSDYLGSIRRPVQPHIFSKYRKDKALGQYELARDPYYGRFKPKECFCEIRLINTHIRFGEDTEEHYSRYGQIKETGQRKNEFRILADIYHTISNRTYGNNMPAYTIILGDYNLNLNREWTTSPYVPWSQRPDVDVYNIDDNGKVQRILTVQDSLTTLRQNQKDTSGNIDSDTFANNYDHFSYDEDRFLGITAKANRVNAAREFNGDYEEYKKKVSDHLPISMNINLKGDKEIVWED